jgi:hypothetical protein
MMRRGLFTLMVALSVTTAPRTALACSVCFGQSDSPMAAGINLGIFVMIGVTGTVLAAFASFFIYLMRRSRLGDAGDAGASAVVPGVPNGPHAQEGTVSC